jgi:excisionase family DNA binding protein
MKTKTKRKSGVSTMGFITREELSNELGVSTSLIKRMTLTSQLPCIRIGSVIRYQREEVIKVLRDAGTVNVKVPVQNNPPPDGALWSPAQIATRTGAHRITVYRWLREGKLKALHLGRLVRVTEQELKRFEQGSME